MKASRPAVQMVFGWWVFFVFEMQQALQQATHSFLAPWCPHTHAGRLQPLNGSLVFSSLCTAALAAVDSRPRWSRISQLLGGPRSDAFDEFKDALDLSKIGSAKNNLAKFYR